MLLKKKLAIITFVIILFAFAEIIPWNIAMAKKNNLRNNPWHLFAGDDYSINGGNGDIEVDEKVVDNDFFLHVNAGEAVKVIWDKYYDIPKKHGNFEVGLVNKKTREEISTNIGQYSHQIKKLEVSKTGVYHFYYRPTEANCKNGNIQYYFDIVLLKNKKNKSK